MELEYRENLSNLKILKALTNLRSTVGNKKANRLGRIAIASIIAEKLKMYFNLTLVLLWFFVLFSTQDHNLPIYSIEKIVTENNSKYLKCFSYCRYNVSTVSRITINILKKIRQTKKISMNFDKLSFSSAGSRIVQALFL
jgi:hypothetical protein